MIAIDKSLTNGNEDRPDLQGHCERVVHKMNMIGCFSRGCKPVELAVFCWLTARRCSSTNTKRNEW